MNKYYINYIYSYNEGYMDNVVDKYDSVNAYLNIINKKDGIKSTIKQEDYNLEYSIDLEFFSRDLEEMARKKVQTLWKKEKNNYDYIIADAYGLFSTFAPNILGVDSDTWWPGTQRDRNEALVNLFDGVREREIYYY
jgi:cellulose biosynthesis protein BcsQ